MKKNVKIIIGVLVVALIAGVGVWAYSGESGQGFFRLRSTKTSVSASLSKSSPKGARTVSVSDEMAKFSICSFGKSTQIGSAEFRVDAHGQEINLEGNATVTAYSVDSVEYEEWDSPNDMGFVTVNFSSRNPMSVIINKCSTLIFKANTDEMLTVRSAVDDLVDISLVSLTDTTGNRINAKGLPVQGNVLKY